ncbi:FtsK/SpoIIIE domain-containing protein [Actinomadura nitritigenes]|uniref:FtsK/SpoIIIE domain-containing protein n=1 Tax=Actinomadura nitritigenes TaxID=134602 RepID=UPI003D8E2132
MSDPILNPNADDDAEVIPLRPAPFGAPDITADPTGDPSGDAPDRDDADDLTDAEGDDDGDGEDGAEVDRESVLIGTVVKGAPVDPPDEPRPFGRRTGKRAPVLPPWIASRTAVRDTARWTIREIRYYLAFHSVRAPKYAAKMAVYAPVGTVRTITRALHWASAEEGNWHLRQLAADKGDADTWLKLDARRQRQAQWRWIVVGALAAAIAAATLYLVFGHVPVWWRLLAAVIALPLLARMGRPADKPITDRVTNTGAYRKLTAELVRRALLNVQLKGITSAVAKDPGAISFPVEIHRDGPGHLAIVDLPYGVEASEVIARRGKLASGLRLPLDQVWPEPAPGHTGRLALWVGFEPASQMRQPKWPLLKGAKVDVFAPFPFATTPRMDVINALLMGRNWLFGGQPGSGKTFALRLLALAAALDPRVELRIYEMKGVGDFKPLAPVCTEYGNGFDDDTLAAAAQLIDWLYAECQRRSKRIEHYADLGKAPENKVTPELASLKGSGLHPLVVVLDELQELMLSPHGKRAGEILEKVIKLGRALGVILLIGTQIPDKDSLPTGITRNVNTRFCLSVADQTANDMILGTSQYKLGHRATAFKPGPPSEGGEAGWGILRGIGETGARCSYYVDADAAARIVEHAIALRTDAGTLPAEATQTREAPAYDVLTDVATVWPAGEDAAWNETLLERLTDLRGEVYATWKPAQLTAALSTHGVKVGQVGRRIDGKTVNRRGPTHADITAAVTDRKQKRSRD